MLFDNLNEQMLSDLKVFSGHFLTPSLTNGSSMSSSSSFDILKLTDVPKINEFKLHVDWKHQ